MTYDEGEIGFRTGTGARRGREITEGDRESECKDIHWQKKINGGSVGGPPNHIQSLHKTWERLWEWGEETTPHGDSRQRQKRNWGSCYKIFWQKQVSGGGSNQENVAGGGTRWARVELSRERYHGKGMGDSQLGGWSCSEVKRAVSSYRARDGLSIVGKFYGKRGGWDRTGYLATQQ